MSEEKTGVKKRFGNKTETFVRMKANAAGPLAPGARGGGTGRFFLSLGFKKRGPQ